MSAALDDIRPNPAGAAATRISVGIIEDVDPNADVRGEGWYGDGSQLGHSHHMMRDPHVRISVDGRVAPIVSALWDTEPDSDDPLDLEVSDFVYHAFFERLDFLGFLRRGTTGYTRDGFDLEEFTDDVVSIPAKRFPRHPGGGKGICYTGIHHRPAWSVDRWYQSTTNPAQIDGFRQRVLGSDTESVGFRDVRFSEGALILRLTWEQEGANFAGFAALRSAFGAWKKKRLLELIEMIRHEREGAPLPEISEPDANQGPVTPEEKEIAKEIARNIRSHEHGYIYLPAGWKFRWVPGAGGETNLRAAQEACARDIAYNLHVAWMLLGQNKTGSYALATEQKGQYILSAEQQARFWEFALNVGQDGWSPVERLVRLNYGDKVGLPRIVARNMPLKDWTQWLALLPQLIQANVVRPDDELEAFVRSVITLPQADTKTTRERPAPVVELGAGKAKPEPKQPEGEEPEDDAGDGEKEAA